MAAVPDPVGPAMNNLEDWLLLPNGCGEQNLEGLLPLAIMLVEVDRTCSSFTGRVIRQRALDH